MKTVNTKVKQKKTKIFKTKLHHALKQKNKKNKKNKKMAQQTSN